MHCCALLYRDCLQEEAAKRKHSMNLSVDSLEQKRRSAAYVAQSNKHIGKAANHNAKGERTAGPCTNRGTNLTPRSLSFTSRVRRKLLQQLNTSGENQLAKQEVKEALLWHFRPNHSFPDLSPTLPVLLEVNNVVPAAAGCPRMTQQHSIPQQKSGKPPLPSPAPLPFASPLPTPSLAPGSATRLQPQGCSQ